MYLKRLEIQGFKSFAGKTVLDFLPPQNGLFAITAVVGPNGSGKSNISDAIRWVMGETSLKNLRGKKSEDVIFGGSEAKGALSAAEVTMVLDNSDDKADFGHPEIAITRRLYRSGEGEYLINNAPVRLLDVHLLLARAQFAAHAYSIVSQGMIDRLLTVSPSERKDFFDEAAGIKEHQIKQHQAELKLARTVENMRQAERLIQEVEPRLKILARQVKKLEKRQEVETNLRAAQESYYFTIYRRNHDEEEKTVAELKTVEDNYRQVFAALEETQIELAALAQSSTRQEVFETLRIKHQETVREKNDLERRLAILGGQMQTEYSQAGKQNISWLETKLAELNAEREKSLARFNLIQAETERMKKIFLEQKKSVEDLTVEKTQLILKISRLQNEFLKGQSEQNYWQYSGLSAVKAILEAKNKFGKVYGLVAELGEVDEPYRLALEVAAAAHLSSVVVEDEKAARLAIDYLRENRLGVATFLPLSKIQGRQFYNGDPAFLNNKDIIGPALELVRYDPKFKEIFSFIFGNTLVVEDLRAAERVGVGKVRMVTLSGDLVERNGAMKGGYRGRRNDPGFSSQMPTAAAERLAEWGAQIKATQNELTELERQIEEAKTKQMEGEVNSRSAAASLESANGEKAKIDSGISLLEQDLSRLLATPEEYGEQLKKMSAEKESCLRLLAKSALAVKKIETEIEEFNRREEEKKQRVFALQGAMQKKQEEVNRVLAARNDLKIQLAKLETKEESLAQEVMNDMNVSLASIVERGALAAAESALEGLVNEIQKLKYQLSLIGGIDEEVTEEYRTTKERFDFLNGQLIDLRAATDDLNQMIEELDELMKKKRAAAFKEIRREFNHYFKILFDGGHADLVEIYGEPVSEEESMVALEKSPPAAGWSPQGDRGGLADVEPTPPLSPPARGDLGEESKSGKRREKVLSGIEVIANPPGKKIKHLSTLSGGERTLTSIALICSILHHNPSPFVVFDEVEAALDEANTGRFVRIMSELRARSQFIIITHNRVTMHAADALYGVVMGSEGVSKLLSVKMEDAPRFEEKQPVAVDKT